MGILDKVTDLFKPKNLINTEPLYNDSAIRASCFTITSEEGQDIGSFLQKNRAYIEDAVLERLGKETYPKQRIFVSNTTTGPNNTSQCIITFDNFDASDIHEVENALKREVWMAFRGECSCGETSTINDAQLQEAKQKYSDVSLGLDAKSQMLAALSSLRKQPTNHTGYTSTPYVREREEQNTSFSL